MTAIIPFDPETFFVPHQKTKEIGAGLAGEYRSKTPYPYICVDNFLPPKVTARVYQEALALGEKAPEHSSENEKLKTSYNPDRMQPYSKALFNALNARPFIQFLEQMSGIKGLIPDPYYQGGGIHRTNTGGYLDIHADFNHHSIMNLERRLNLLIYLNEDWKEEYGGSFEVWTNNMSEKVESFVPVMNRMCCFSTGDDTMHGNPEPVNHPDGKPRLSIALYYYTATWEEGRVTQSTVFKPRPGTQDARNSEARLRIVREFVPPILYRNGLRAYGKASRIIKGLVSS